jgi:hypothetical protein
MSMFTGSRRTALISKSRTTQGSVVSRPGSLEIMLQFDLRLQVERSFPQSNMTTPQSKLEISQLELLPKIEPFSITNSSFMPE